MSETSILSSEPKAPSSESDSITKRDGPQTQKARGIINGIGALLDQYPFTWSYFYRAYHHLIQDFNHIGVYAHRSGGKFFARPCPITPKHGFVESRLVSSYEEIVSLFKETLAEDPNGELLLGPAFHNISFNAIYTETGCLSIGPGNDGATGGKGSVQFPVSPIVIKDEVKATAGIGKDDVAYLEIVYGSLTKSRYTSPHLVQMRGGPAINAVDSDYIPEQITVTNVIVPNENLLIWAKQVESISPGTVVWGAGHTLSSHAAVHCIIHKIPFITSHEPAVGEVISPSNNVEQKALSTLAFKQGIMSGLKSDLSQHYGKAQLLAFSLSILHNWAYLRNTEYAPQLLGNAIATFQKICLSLILGEHRHKGNAGYHGMERNAVYEDVLQKNSCRQFEKLVSAFDSFTKEHWKAGFGGNRWAICAHYCIELWNEMSKAYNSTQEYVPDEHVTSLISSFNKMINLSHNNGWWLNKITSSDILDMAAQTPGLTAAYAAPLFINAIEASKSAKLLNRLFKIKVDDIYFKDTSHGMCTAYIDSNSWLTILTEQDKKQSAYVSFSSKQKEWIESNLSTSGNNKIYLRHIGKDKFSLGPWTIRVPFKMEWSK